MVNLPVYMDNHATTRVDPRVIEAMLPLFDPQFGNAGSATHVLGWDARDAVDRAREAVAAAIGARAKEIVFTSGATESNNLALLGAARRLKDKRRHLITVRTEHKAVLDPLAHLEKEGFEVTRLDVVPHESPQAGWLDPQRVADALRDDTALVSVMAANNEIGVIQPIAEIAAFCADRGALLHCDATQAVGRMPVDVNQLGVDLMSFTAHKMFGPKGVGGLYVRRRSPVVRLLPLVFGGGQEAGLRSGTLNVPGIVGLAKSLSLCLDEMSTEPARLTGLRNRLYRQLTEVVSDTYLCGPSLDRPDLRLPGNLMIGFERVDGEALMMSMRELAVSGGSACTSANPEPDHVLLALGLSDQHARGCLRFGLGRFNTSEEVDFAVATVAEAVERLRKMSSLP